MISRRRAAAWLSSAALALGACGDDSSASSSTGGGASAAATTATTSQAASSTTSATVGAGGSGDGGASAGGGGSGPGGAGGTGGGSAYALGLNDVSILYPIGDAMLRATDETGEGPLLPLAAFEAVGTIDGNPGKLDGSFDPEPVEVTWPELRVVGVRLDPCFRDLGVETCRSMIRMVMQPIAAGELADDALHVFYDLDEDAFEGLVDDLAHLASGASASTDGPLGVHPVLAAEGLDGPFATELRAILLGYVARGTLTRVTAMTLVLPGGTWKFHGVNFDGGAPVDIGILGSFVVEQVINNFGNQGYSATVTPAFTEDEPFSLFWDADTARAASPTEQQNAYDAANAIENPDLFTAEEQTCVSCHTAGPARAWAERELDVEDSPNRFTSDFDLSLDLDASVLEDTTQLRAFGYRGSGAVFSQRTVNESAAVATAINDARR